VKESSRTLLFAGLLGLVCAVLLAGVSLFTAPFRQANEKAEEVRNYLTALGAPMSAETGTRELLEVFENDVQEVRLGDITVYEYAPGSTAGGAPLAVAVPFSGIGLWGPIRGVLALDSELRTIRAIRFYQQEETPGLGGEIGAEWFQKQFEGKQIANAAGEPGFRVLKPGSPSELNAVDAITGATMTSQRVQTIVDELAKRLWKERQSYVR
jgi:Na+-transporting NADH:ubiquinone oxidoreductase subunit C